MKLKFTYRPKKDANGYYLLLPNGTQKRFKTKKSFDRWFLAATNELNGVFKILLIRYPLFSEFYSELFVRSNVYNLNRLAFLQKTNDETRILVKIFGIIPRRGFYEAYTDLYRLLSFYEGLLDTYYQEYILFSDRYVLNRIHLVRDILDIQKFKLDNL